MQINKTDGISFRADLKKLWDAGHLPSVVKGFYGQTLTSANISREHLLPKSMGGTLQQDNIVLADKLLNGLRGNEPIAKHASKETTTQYLEQFKGIKLPKFDGDKYIKQITETLKRLNAPLEEIGKHLDLQA